MVSERSRREAKKHGQTKAAGALARLAELRGGKKQTFDIKEEEDVFDTMDDDEYAQHVSKRREEGGGSPNSNPHPLLLDMHSRIPSCSMKA